MPLDHPPGEPGALTAFPARVVEPGDRGQALYRIFRHRDHETGRPRSPFFFASAGPDEREGGRYDLPHPDGACYLATTPVGAWLEKFRQVGTVALEDVEAHRLLATRPPRRLRAANVVDRAARRFGVTAEISTTADYALTRRWARALHRDGFRAIWGLVRHDPGLRARSLTLLDQAGERQPFGWRWRQTVVRLDAHSVLTYAVARLGYRVVEIPNDVPTG